jgi:hypothetical protein
VFQPHRNQDCRADGEHEDKQDENVPTHARRLCRNLHKEALNPVDGWSTAELLASRASARPPARSFTAPCVRTPQNPVALGLYALQHGLGRPPIPPGSPGQKSRQTAAPRRWHRCAARLGMARKAAIHYPHTQRTRTSAYQGRTRRPYHRRPAPSGGVAYGLFGHPLPRAVPRGRHFAFFALSAHL